MNYKPDNPFPSRASLRNSQSEPGNPFPTRASLRKVEVEETIHPNNEEVKKEDTELFTPPMKDTNVSKQGVESRTSDVNENTVLEMDTDESKTKVHLPEVTEKKAKSELELFDVVEEETSTLPIMETEWNTQTSETVKELPNWKEVQSETKEEVVSTESKEPFPKRVEVHKVKDKVELPGLNVEVETETVDIESKNKRNKIILTAIIVSVFVITAVVIGVMKYIEESSKVVVPMAAKQYSETVCKDFTELELKCSVSKEYSSTVQKNKLISQSLPKGEIVKKDDSILLLYSDGPRFVEVPNLSGMKLEEAKREIEESNLSFGGVVEIDSPDVKENSVIKSTIAPGTTVLNGTAIFLEVSTGAFIIPDFLDMTKEQAEIEAEKYELKLTFVEKESSEAPGIVIAQSPVAKEVTKDKDVKLTLSKPKEVIELKMPDVVGMTEEEAQIELSITGFQQIMIVEVTNSEVDSPIITDTVPSAGQKVDSNEKIVLIKSNPEPEKDEEEGDSR